MFNAIILSSLILTWIVCGWETYTINKNIKGPEETIASTISIFMGIGFTVFLAIIWIIHWAIGCNWVIG